MLPLSFLFSFKKQKEQPKQGLLFANKQHLASPSICLRDSAFALHLRHTTECVLQRVLCIPVFPFRKLLRVILFLWITVYPVFQKCQYVFFRKTHKKPPWVFSCLEEKRAAVYTAARNTCISRPDSAGKPASFQLRRMRNRLHAVCRKLPR